MRPRSYHGRFAAVDPKAHIAGVTARVAAQRAAGVTPPLRSAEEALSNAQRHLQQGAVSASRAHADAAARHVAAHRAALASLAPPPAVPNDRK